MSGKFFKVLSNSNEAGCKARTGIIKTAHSEIKTPVFMPVGTLGTVKAIEQRELKEIGFDVILSNTYHLYLRPGMDVIESAGGLHKFMNWDRGILTDSGGFQVFSLSDHKKVSADGVEFASHLNGDKHFFSPEKIIDLQREIGSDIMMPLDECLPYPVDEKRTSESIKLTVDWEKRCMARFDETKDKYGFDQFLFSINQGSTFKKIRTQCIEQLNEINFDGNAIGGLAVGEPADLMYELSGFCADLLPENKPRYLMGVGTPVDLLECIERGIDMFDCVIPTRNARHGRIYTTYGELNIKNNMYKNDFNAPDEECKTYTSENFSMAYLRHLFISNEILGSQLLTIHNLGFYNKLIKDIRCSINEDRFIRFKKEFLQKYNSKSTLEK